VISVLLPSRGRSRSLLATVKGLLGLAADPGDVEVLIAADPDDDGTLDLARDGQLPGQVRIWVAPERFGYKRINDYFNTLAEMAKGEWLMLWNDDAIMLTPRWDEVICGESPGVLWPAADYATNHNTFPVWPAAWTRHIGHVSLDQSTDMWVHDISMATGTSRRIPVSIHHEHRCGDQTAADRDAVADVITYHQPQMVAARQRDTERLREFLRQ
jgi:hypothetical protein